MTPSKSSNGLLETVKTIVYAGLIAIVIRTVAYEPFNIPSSSMVPTLLIGDYLFVSKFSYGYSRFSLPFGLPLWHGRIFASPPQRGDVVVFKLPSDNTTDYIKRVISLPGDRIQMINGVLNINGQPVKRTRVADFVEHLPDGSVIARPEYEETLPGGRVHPVIEILGDTGPYDNTGVYVVPQGYYFMMGDNRDNSSDSRIPPSEGGVGYVPFENIVGRAEFLFFSTNGSARLWQVWKWPLTVRYDRLFQGIK